jgi:hypothetical protein
MINNSKQQEDYVHSNSILHQDYSCVEDADELEESISMKDTEEYTFFAKKIIKLGKQK